MGEVQALSVQHVDADGTATEAEQESLSLLLKRADHALRQRLQPILDAEDLLVEHWQIMAVLLAQPGLRMSDIAGAAVVPAATLTRHMDKLVERALVVRRIDPEDKRRVVAALSPMGHRLAVRLQAEERAVEASLAKGLGAIRYAGLVRELTLTPHLFD